MKVVLIVLGVIFGSFIIGGCTIVSFVKNSYNSFQVRDEGVKKRHAGMIAVYQKRADLVPQLVETVKGYSTHESDVFVKVAEARASAGKVNIDVSKVTQADMDTFMKAQSALQSSLSRLLVSVESNPTLKANTNFLKLQDDLKEMETQVAASRRQYIQEVAAYNVNVRNFPTNLIAKYFDYNVKPQLQLGDENELKIAPKVNFLK